MVTGSCCRSNCHSNNNNNNNNSHSNFNNQFNKSPQASEFLDSDSQLLPEAVTALEELNRSLGWRIVQAYAEFFARREADKSFSLIEKAIASKGDLSLLNLEQAHINGIVKGYWLLAKFPEAMLLSNDVDKTE